VKDCVLVTQVPDLKISSQTVELFDNTVTSL